MVEGHMILEIFDVEHGACALVTTGNGKHVLIDCGDNTSTGWEPGTVLRKRGITAIERLIVTNYDEDHVSGYPNLLQNVVIGGLQRNNRINAATIRYLKSEDGIGVGIQTLTNTIDSLFNGPALPDNHFGDMTIRTFSNPYGVPPLGFDDENNLSLVVFLSCGAHRIIFPGDMEKSGWRMLLRDPAFVAMLSGVNIFIASHHGRENGYCEEVMRLCPHLRVVIISDKKKGFQSQETTNNYRLHTNGFNYFGTERHVLTTRSDGSMTFLVPATGDASVWLGTKAA
jgi:beta-lactamase superfamily II metal-dependent hydrolase